MIIQRPLMDLNSASTVLKFFVVHPNLTLPMFFDLIMIPYINSTKKRCRIMLQIIFEHVNLCNKY